MPENYSAFYTIIAYTCRQYNITFHFIIAGLSSSSNYSLSDDDDSLPFDGRLSNGQQEIIEKNIELEQSLKRLALLDKTQEEIEKISKVMDCSNIACKILMIISAL